MHLGRCIGQGSILSDEQQDGVKIHTSKVEYIGNTKQNLQRPWKKKQLTYH